VRYACRVRVPVVDDDVYGVVDLTHALADYLLARKHDFDQLAERDPALYALELHDAGRACAFGTQYDGPAPDGEEPAAFDEGDWAELGPVALLGRAADDYPVDARTLLITRVGVYWMASPAGADAPLYFETPALVWGRVLAAATAPFAPPALPDPTRPFVPPAPPAPPAVPGRAGAAEAQCANCGGRFSAWELAVIEDADERVGPDDDPAGQCPDCWELCWWTGEEADE
jgi:hypothetical protein